MHKLNGFHLLATLLAFTGLARADAFGAELEGADAFGAELEGALQYPPGSIGEDAQPPRRRECCHSPYHGGVLNWA